LSLERDGQLVSTIADGVDDSFTMRLCTLSIMRSMRDHTFLVLSHVQINARHFRLSKILRVRCTKTMWKVLDQLVIDLWGMAMVSGG